MIFVFQETEMAHIRYGSIQTGTYFRSRLERPYIKVWYGSLDVNIVNKKGFD